MSSKINKVSPVAITAARTGKREVGVLQLIEWAFQRECVSLDIGEQETGIETRQSVDPIVQMLEINRLGCRVQGGGRSSSHHDADIVAGTLAALPEGCGGRRVAVWIASLATSGLRPDVGAQRTVRPADQTTNRHGTCAKKADAAELGDNGWPNTQALNRKGRLVTHKVEYCPVVIRPSVAEQAAMRRNYLQWWGALLDVKAALQISHLTSHVVSNVMPPRTPWKKIA